MNLHINLSLQNLIYSLESAVLTLVILLGIGLFFACIRHFFSAIIPGGFAIINYGTIPGVMHHELSHALFAFLTGAKVTEIKLFKLLSFDGTLGSVSYQTRGGRILQGLQSFFSAIAPIPCGIVSSLLLYVYALPHARGNIALVILVYYLIICIVLHMELSLLDLVNLFQGLPVVFVMITIVYFLMDVRLVTVIAEFIRFVSE